MYYYLGLEARQRENHAEFIAFRDKGERFSASDGERQEIRLRGRIDLVSAEIREIRTDFNAHLQSSQRYISEIERLKQDMKDCLRNCWVIPDNGSRR